MKKTNRLVTIFLMVCMVLASGGLLYATMYASGAGTQSTQTTVAFDAPSGIRYNELTGAFEVFSGVGVSWIGSNGWVSTLGEYDKSTDTSPPETGTAGVWYQATRTSTYNIMCDISYSSVFQSGTSNFVTAYNEAFNNGITLDLGGTIYGRGFFLSGFPVRNNASASALIAVNNGTIRDINIKDADFTKMTTSNTAAGVLCGTNSSTGLIDGCTVYGSYSTARFTNLFGIAAVSEGTIMNCANNANFTNTKSSSYTAGIAEVRAASNLVNSTNNGIITATNGTSYAAGVAICMTDVEVIVGGNVNNGAVTAGTTATGVVGGNTSLYNLRATNNKNNGQLSAARMYYQYTGRVADEFIPGGNGPVTGIRWNPDLYLFEMYNTAGVSYIASGFWISPQGLISNVAMEGYKQADSFSTYRLMNDVEYDDTEPYFNESFKDVTKAPNGRGPVIGFGGIVDGGGHTLYYFPTRAVGIVSHSAAGESAFLLANYGLISNVGFVMPIGGCTVNSTFSAYVSSVGMGEYEKIWVDGELSALSANASSVGVLLSFANGNGYGHVAGYYNKSKIIIREVINSSNIVSQWRSVGISGVGLDQYMGADMSRVINFGNLTGNGGIGGIYSYTITSFTGVIRITECENYGNITSTSTSTASSAGDGAAGIARGFNWKSGSALDNCLNRGLIVAENSTAAGIILRIDYNNTSIELTGHKNLGNITGKNVNEAGAIVAYCYSTGSLTMNNCYNSGGVGIKNSLVYGTNVRFLGNSDTLFKHNGTTLISEDLRGQ